MSCCIFNRPAESSPVLLKILPSCHWFLLPCIAGRRFSYAGKVHYRQESENHRQGTPIMQQEVKTRGRDAFFCSRETVL